ncbi:MAG TPA: YlxR family protein [Mycobacteriales bacterium]|nr:YlxR family protein [Mycobacteriales bacterium]
MDPIGVDSPVGQRPAPVRTCAGCRKRAAKSDLLRVVAVGGEVVIDRRGRLPGRGAHLHPTLECVELADRRRALPRALRTEGPLDCSGLRRALEQH